MSGNSDLSVFDNPIEENGVKYYVFPAGYPLFKANKNPAIRPTTFRDGIPSFFGVKNIDEGYIKAFESEYGIVFEFVTKREYKLIALDDPVTQANLYNKAPEDIQKILKDNYGYGTGIRNSVGEKDKQLAMYLCNLGLEGYATNKMHTDFSEFHIELLICNAKDGIEFSRQITDDSKAEYIISDAKSKKLDEDLRNARKKKRRYEDEDTMDISVSPPRKNMFESPPRGNMFESPPRGNMFGSESPTATGKLSSDEYRTPGGKKREKKTYKKNAKGKRKTNRRRIKK